MTSLNPPVYATPDAKAAETELQTQLSTTLGKTLFPAQPETLLANWAAYLKTIVDAKIQYTGEQNLVNYATGSNLDQLGAFFDVTRLDAQPALTTVEFTLSGVKASNYVIPAGTRVRTSDKNYLFATLSNAIVLAGELTATAIAQCTVTGEGANGYPIGDLTELFDLVSDVASVTNTTATNSGSNVESDEGFRVRLKLAPNSLTTAGSRDSYKFWALSADPNITDVSVTTVEEELRSVRRDELALEAATATRAELISTYGVNGALFTAADLAEILAPFISINRFYVEVYVLTATGLPSAEILNKVRDTLNQETVRPITDTVYVSAPTQVNASISASIVAFSSADTSQLLADLNTAIAAYAAEVGQQLGRDIVISQIVERLQLPGVYSVTINTPANDVAIAYNQRPFITSTSINITGVTNG